MTVKTPTPCAFDTRPLRITLFPEHPQTILVYVPEGQTLWLPALPTPFDLDMVCDFLDEKDVPHDTREGDRNRWWRNIKQSANDAASEQGALQRAAEAERLVRIHLSSTATTEEKQRAEVVLMKYKVLDELRELQAERKKITRNALTYAVCKDTKVFRDREDRIADLKRVVIALDKKLSGFGAKRREQAQANRSNREQRFIEKAKRLLSREQFLAIWKEIDQEEESAP